jgi:hypothetical protein
MLTQLFISLIYSFTYWLYAFRAFNQDSCYSANHMRIFGEPKFSVPSVAMSGMFLSLLFVFSLTLHVLEVHSTPDDNNFSIRSPEWSKEALFGLLSILFVVVVPRIGLMVRYCIMHCTTSALSKDTGMHLLHLILQAPVVLKV